MDGKELMTWLWQPWARAGLSFLAGAVLGAVFCRRGRQPRRMTAGQWIFVLSLATIAAVVVAAWKDQSTALQILGDLLSSLAGGALSWRTASESSKRTSVATRKPQSPAILGNGNVVVRYNDGCPGEPAFDAMDAKEPEPLSATAQDCLETWEKQSPAIKAKGDVEVSYHDSRSRKS